MKSALAIALNFAVISSVSAFEVEGIRSGMSIAELRKVAAARQLELWQVAPGSWVMGRSAKYEIVGSFGVCDATGLNGYIRPLDPDVEYVGQVERSINALGQPSVTVSRNLWNGPGGGEVVNVNMEWQRGNTRMTLSYGPEGRDGKGNLRHTRGASISYVDMSKLCP